MKISPEHHLFFMEIINGVFDGNQTVEFYFSFMFLKYFFKQFLENVPNKILEGGFQIYY